jgi:eukaryotic-like serine/threonine-protein kinase
MVTTAVAKLTSGVVLLGDQLPAGRVSKFGHSEQSPRFPAVVVSGGEDWTVRVWRLVDGSPVGDPLRGHDGVVSSVAVGTLSDGTLVVVSGSWDGTICVSSLFMQ